MKRGFAVALLLIIPLLGLAQDLSKVQRMPATIFDIPFPFYADKTLVPAGTYEIRPNFESTGIEVRNVKGPEIILVRGMTTLSTRPLSNADLVFDVVGQEHYLSEFYLPGVDGIAFRGVPSKHKHEVLVPKKA